MSDRTCIIEGCDKKRHVSAGYCGMHYYRINKYGEPNPVMSRNERRGMSCVIEGCGRQRYSGKYGWCAMHYDRWFRHGDPLKTLRRMPSGRERQSRDGECEVEGCSAPIRARRVCSYHHQRRSKGLPDHKVVKGCPIKGCHKRPSKHSASGHCREHAPDLVIPPPKKRVCAVHDCKEKHHSNGLCAVHYRRFQLHGSTDKPPVKTGEQHHRWTQEPTYSGLHQRIVTAFGSANSRDCVDCGAQAQHWSYDGTDDNYLVNEQGLKYSTDIDRYQPRCVPCHSRFDRETGQGEIIAFAG